QLISGRDTQRILKATHLGGFFCWHRQRVKYFEASLEIKRSFPNQGLALRWFTSNREKSFGSID
ncbi:hypothetical protein, partial [Leeuwenhoekiella blandensis]